MMTLLATLALAMELNVHTQTLQAGDKKISVSIFKNKKDDEHGSRLEVKVDGKTALNYKAEVCVPGENFKDPGCDNLVFSVKKASLLEIRNEFDASSVDQASYTYLYRWQNNEFELIGATSNHWNTGQVQERESETTDINYSTGKALQEHATENDKGPKSHESKTCKLKKSRKGESLSKFSTFNIDEEVTCESKK